MYKTKKRLTMESIADMIQQEFNYDRMNLENKKIEVENLQQAKFLAEQRQFKAETQVEKMEEVEKSLRNEIKTITEAHKKIENGYLEKIKELQADKKAQLEEIIALKELNKKMELEIEDLKSDRYLKVELPEEKIPKGQKLKVKSGARTSKIIKEVKEGKEEL